MATGVASHFLQLLEDDQKAARQRIIVSVVLALVLGAVAAVLTEPWFVGLGIHVGAVIVGAVVGGLVAGSATRRYETSIKDGWQRWMRFSVASETLPEIARKVKGQSSRNLPFRHAALVATAWILELMLLLVALDGEHNLLWALPVLLANGLMAGALLGHAFRLRTWTGALRDSVGDLVQSGELGMWGVV